MDEILEKLESLAEDLMNQSIAESDDLEKLALMSKSVGVSKADLVVSQHFLGDKA